MRDHMSTRRHKSITSARMHETVYADLQSHINPPASNLGPIHTVPGSYGHLQAQSDFSSNRVHVLSSSLLKDYYYIFLHALGLLFLFANTTLYQQLEKPFWLKTSLRHCEDRKGERNIWKRANVEMRPPTKCRRIGTPTCKSTCQHQRRLLRSDKSSFFHQQKDKSLKRNGKMAAKKAGHVALANNTIEEKRQICRWCWEAIVCGA